MVVSHAADNITGSSAADAPSRPTAPLQRTTPTNPTSSSCFLCTNHDCKVGLIAESMPEGKTGRLLLIGIPVSIGCSRLIANQLYQIKGWDPFVLSGAIIALGFCALVASIISARKAASINPVTALRTE